MTRPQVEIKANLKVFSDSEGSRLSTINKQLVRRVSGQVKGDGTVRIEETPPWVTQFSGTELKNAYSVRERTHWRTTQC